MRLGDAGVHRVHEREKEAAEYADTSRSRAPDARKCMESQEIGWNSSDWCIRRKVQGQNQ